MHTQFCHRFDMDAEPNSWLLLAEGDCDGALTAVDESLTTLPRELINRHVTRARIFLQQGRRKDAAEELDTGERERSRSGYGQLNNDILALRQEIAA
jgi:hypothetical protein